MRFYQKKKKVFTKTVKRTMQREVLKGKLAGPKKKKNKKSKSKKRR